MGKHAKYAPSSIDRVIKCTESAVLPKTTIEGTNEAAEEGTRFHELCENKILGVKFDPSQYDDEMMEHAPAYVNYALALKSTAEYFSVEQMFKYDDKLFGTADLVSIKDGVLQISDIKYGRIPVVPEASQLKTYCFMAYMNLKDQYEIKSFKTAIYQPRVYSDIQEAEFSLRQITEFGQYVLEVIADIENGITSYKVGSHCKYCKSKLHCEEIKRRTEGRKPPKVMTDEELQDALDAIPALEGYIKDLQEYAFNVAREGQYVRGYKLVRKNTHRRWAEGVTADRLAMFIPMEKLIKESLITPTQAFKFSSDIPEEYVTKPEGGLILVPEDDRRKAVEVLDVDALSNLNL